jgi:ClpP class serine protease
MGRYGIFLVVNLFVFSVCAGDTFTNRQTGESFDGFATQQVRAGKTIVRSAGSESSKSINLSEYDVRWNFNGRRNQVIVLPIKDAIELESETALFEKALESASNQGPLFVVLAIDTPGGREDLMKRICKALSNASYCKTVSYICGGQYGGAYSAGAVISLACDYIYMADNTAIGAATPVMISSKGEVKDLKSQYGETVGEKYLSADRAFVAAVAEENGRSPALAKAMVDKDIRVVEVVEDGRKKFIEPKDKKPSQTVMRTVNESGKLLTLTAAQAVDCGIADGRAGSIEELINALGANGARIVQSSEYVKAKRGFEKFQRDYNKIMEQADKIEKEIDRLVGNINELDKEWDKLNNNFNIGNRETLMRKISQRCQTTLRDLVRNLKQLISLYNEAIALNKRCPDLNLDVQSFEKAINSAQTSLRQAQGRLND